MFGYAPVINWGIAPPTLPKRRITPPEQPGGQLFSWFVFWSTWGIKENPSVEFLFSRPLSLSLCSLHLVSSLSHLRWFVLLSSVCFGLVFWCFEVHREGFYTCHKVQTTSTSLYPRCLSIITTLLTPFSCYFLLLHIFWCCLLTVFSLSSIYLTSNSCLMKDKLLWPWKMTKANFCHFSHADSLWSDVYELIQCQLHVDGVVVSLCC